MGIAGVMASVAACSIIRSIGAPTPTLMRRSGLNAFTCKSCGVRSVEVRSKVMLCSSIGCFFSFIYLVRLGRSRPTP